MNTPKKVLCPKCRTQTVYDLTNEFRPFCSARCKNDDIVAWADGAYRVPTKEVPDDAESLPSDEGPKGRSDERDSDDFN